MIFKGLLIKQITQLFFGSWESDFKKKLKYFRNSWEHSEIVQNKFTVKFQLIGLGDKTCCNHILESAEASDNGIQEAPKYYNEFGNFS